MDIGAEFDDDFFEKPKEKVVRASNSEIKICSPLWFMDSKLVDDDPSSVLVALKHQADYHYVSKNYSGAIEMYERCMELVPDKNNTWRREFMENLARSLLHLGDAEKALEWSLKLYKASVSPDQKVVSMNLLADVCHALGKYKEELEALHHCVEAHQCCPELWYRLGLCYSGLFDIHLPDCSATAKADSDEVTEACCVFKSRMNSVGHSEELEKSQPTTNLVNSPETVGSSSSRPPSEEKSGGASCEEDDSKCHTCRMGCFMVSSCLIRTRTLIDSRGQNLLGKERDELMKEKIAKSLNHMEIDQSFIDVASKSLGSDFLPGLRRSENSKQHGESSAAALNKTPESKNDL